MMDMASLKFIGFLCFVLAGLLICLIAFFSRKEASSKGKMGYSHYGKRQFLLILYPLLLRTWPFSSYMKNIRRRLEIHLNIDELAIRRKVVKTLFIIMALWLGLLFVFALITQSILSVLFVSIILNFVADSFLDIFVIRLSNRLMAQQIHFNNQIRHYYYQVGDLHEALYEAADDMNESSPEISSQGMVIYDLLTSSDVEGGMASYGDRAPNRFLSLLIALIYSASEYGDIRIDGQSSFTKNLSNLNEEIRLELRKRKAISYYFRSLNLITLIPLLFMTPLRNWASSNFYSMELFYESNNGFLLEVSMYLITLIAYSLIRGIQKTDGIGDLKAISVIKHKKLIKLLAFLIPTKHTSKRKRVDLLLKQSGARMSIEVFYLRKVFCLVSIFILTIILSLILHQKTIYTVLNTETQSTSDSSFLGGRPSEDQVAAMEVQAQKDKVIIGSLGNDKSLKAIEEALRFQDPEALMKISIKRIQDKINLIGQAYFRWYELWLAMVLGFIAFYVPDLLMLYRRRLMVVEAENEVSMFQSIILMLVHLNRMSVEEVLRWMTDYAIIYKNDLEKCLLSYDAGAYEALANLVDEVDNETFKELLGSLMNVVSGLTLKEAFDELSSEKDYFFKEREVMNTRIITSKRNSGNLVGFLPSYALITLYFGLPLVSVSINEINQFYQTI